MTKRVMMGVVAVVAVLASGCYSAFDFNGDDKADRIWVTADGVWHQEGKPNPIWTSPNANQAVVPGNYDGSANWEPASTDGTSWFTAGSAGTIDFPFPEGAAGQGLPVPADYDGDGKTDPAWWSRTTGTWYIRGRDPVVFGTPGPSSYCTPLPAQAGCNAFLHGDLPLPADYDGDKRADLAVYNLASGVWQFLADGSTLQLGGHGDVPVVADFDGDGTQDPATFDLLTGVWTVEGLGDIATYGVVDPTNGPQYPVAADYTGDKVADLAYISQDSSSNSPWPWTWHTQGQPDLSLGLNSRLPTPAEMPPAVLVNFVRAWFLTICDTSSLCPGFYS